MNVFKRKLQNRLRMHPKFLYSLLICPNQHTIDLLDQAKLLESPGIYLAGWLKPVLAAWEVQACEGNEYLALLISRLEKVRLSPISEEERYLRNTLARQKILASTPGIFPFSPVSIQKNLYQILESADTLADLPQFEVVHLPNEELLPLREEFERFSISPHSRRYIENLYTAERREAVLSVLAYLTKNYPILSVSRQAYALMLVLEPGASWSNHPFCLRLLYNRYWNLCLNENLG